ncbi:hypothetical protein D3C73_706770 [compost metagenome]
MYKNINALCLPQTALAQSSAFGRFCPDQRFFRQLLNPVGQGQTIEQAKAPLHIFQHRVDVFQLLQRVNPFQIDYRFFRLNNIVQPGITPAGQLAVLTVRFNGLQGFQHADRLLILLYRP